jgi:hypothetical protein
MFVTWIKDHGGKIFGREGATRKIIFPQKGRQDWACLKSGHRQECRVVRDTKPEDEFRGALIVEPLNCPDCGWEAKVAEGLSDGWAIKDGNLVAPDGVVLFRASKEGDLARAKSAYARRQLVAEKLAWLLANVGEAKKLPPVAVPALPTLPAYQYPPGTMIAVDIPVQSDWYVNEWERQRAPHESVWVADDGRLGVQRISPTFEYESEDGRGTRTGGGNPYLLELPAAKHLADDPRVLAARAELRQQQETYAAWSVAFPKAKERLWEAHQAWLAWWRALPDLQKVRVMLTTSRGGIAGTRSTTVIFGAHGLEPGPDVLVEARDGLAMPLIPKYYMGRWRLEGKGAYLPRVSLLGGLIVEEVARPE